MKKNILLLTLSIILICEPVFAASTCKLSSGPAESIKGYIKDVQTVITELKGEVGSTSCGKALGQIDKVHEVLVTGSNTVLDFGSFLSSWEFNVYPLFIGGIPKEFYRDHDYLESQGAKIKELGDYLGKKCAAFDSVKSAKVKEIANKYAIVGTNRKIDVVKGFGQVNNIATNYLRCNIAPTAGKCINEYEIEFIDQIATDYNSSVKDECNEASPSFSSIMKSIGNLFGGDNGFKGISKGIGEWEEALDMLGQTVGTKGTSTNYKNQERTLLADYMAKNGIKASQAEAILGNLSCVNGTASTNEIGKCINTGFARVYGGITKAYNDLGNAIDEIMINPATQTKNIQSVENFKDISTDVANDYENMKALLSNQTAIQEKSIANLIQLHNNLIETNKKIEKALPDSEAVCNLQAQGQGNCSTK